MADWNWFQNTNGNWVAKTPQGLCTVFFVDKPNELGWKFVCEGEFSELIPSLEDAKEDAEDLWG